MNRSAYVGCFLILTVTGLVGCSSGPSASEAKKPPAAPDKIQGKTQILLDEASATDAALNAGGQSTYIWQGPHRYRLFFKSPTPIDPGKEYIAEGLIAQKAIDEIGDPDQGKNGYPLESSCERVIRRAWPGLPFDVNDLHAAALRSRIKRYPARPVLLVSKITPVTAEGGAEAKKNSAKDPDDKLPEISVPADKESALRIEGATTQPAPLWEPKGGTVRCKVIIGKDGKIAELETGTQLCEAVPWAQFRYQPPVKGKSPAKANTEIAITFEPRK